MMLSSRVMFLGGIHRADICCTKIPGWYFGYTEALEILDRVG